MAKGGSGIGGSPKSARNGVDNSSLDSETSWQEWGDVKVTYYPKPAPETDSIGGSVSRPSGTPLSTTPITPTPVRRSSNLGPQGQRSNRLSSSDDSPLSAPRSALTTTEDTPPSSTKTIEISSSEIKSKGLHVLLQENITGLTKEVQYELLTKLRVADALTSSLEARRQILAIRLLAITNLAYVHPESIFHDNTMKQDSDEPRRLQLAYQLAELVHPPAEGDVAVPRALQTVAFSALNALAQHQSKYSDVCGALNTNVNHGVLLYVIRKAVAEMNEDDSDDRTTEEDEWRNALFLLISSIAVMPRTSADLITAGLIPILVEILNLRTAVAGRYHPKILAFLDNIMYNTRDAFQNLVNADGLDALSNLIVHEVTTSAENAASSKAMQPEHRSTNIDYEIPYFQQQTLKLLFKFIHHMMTTAGGYGGNFDRLLRNLIDSSQLLGSLRQIIGNAQCYGSIVWTNAVTILNDFINNEPTSFAVIAEAGLSRGLLEAVTCSSIPSPPEKKDEPHTNDVDQTAGVSSPSGPTDDEVDDSDNDHAPPRPSLSELQTPREGPLAKGIMPTSDTINIIPQAFGAICLNNAGMKMFQVSGALESFFEIFESPEHIKCMEANHSLPASLGSTFDELIRHHPPLKNDIMNSILNMVVRVSSLCKTNAEKNKIGAKLWTLDSTGKLVIADKDIKPTLRERFFKGKGKAVDLGGDVEMIDADADATDTGAAKSPTSSDSMTPYVTAVATFLSAVFSSSAVRADFSSKGGIESVLDLAESPCLTYDFMDGSSSRTLNSVIALLAEQKPNLTMPSLLRRAQAAADVLVPFANHKGRGPFFEPFVTSEARESADINLLAKGTEFAKALVNIHSLISALHSCFQSSAFNHRSANTSFNQLNLGDYYIRLVQSLGPILGASFNEAYQLKHAVPDVWKGLSRVKDSAFSESDDYSLPGHGLVGISDPDADLQSIAQPNGNNSTLQDLRPADRVFKTLTKTERVSPEFRNFQTLQHLVGKLTGTISPFFQTLGKGLASKSRGGGHDPFQKQSHYAIADALAETILGQLAPRVEEPAVENTTHWMGALDVLKDMLIDGKFLHYPVYYDSTYFQFL